MVSPVKMQSLPPVFDQKFDTCSITLPYSKISKPDQNFGCRLTAQVTMQSQLFDDPSNSGSMVERRLVHVDLTNSSVDAPKNCLSEDWCRGYYVESVNYRMWLQDASHWISISTPLPTWSIMLESPNTSNQTGAISNSMNFGFNASTGMFGDMGTVNIGANIGVSNTHSVTLTDFTFAQHSDAQMLDHTISMTMCGDGAAYKEPYDLVDAWQNPFVGIQLRTLSTMATSNVPIPGQAVWMNNSPAGLVDKLVLAIMIKPTWQLIDGENGPPLSALSAEHHYFWEKYIELDMSKIKQS